MKEYNMALMNSETKEITFILSEKPEREHQEKSLAETEFYPFLISLQHRTDKVFLYTTLRAHNQQSMHSCYLAYREFHQTYAAQMDKGKISATWSMKTN